MKKMLSHNYINKNTDVALARAKGSMKKGLSSGFVAWKIEGELEHLVPESKETLKGYWIGCGGGCQKDNGADLWRRQSEHQKE